MLIYIVMTKRVDLLQNCRNLQNRDLLQYPEVQIHILFDVLKN